MSQTLKKIAKNQCKAVQKRLKKKIQLKKRTTTERCEMIMIGG